MRLAGVGWARWGRRVGLATVLGALVMPSVALLPAVSNAAAVAIDSSAPGSPVEPRAVSSPIAPLPTLADPAHRSRPRAARAAVGAADAVGAGGIWLGSAVFEVGERYVVVLLSEQRGGWSAAMGRLTTAAEAAGRELS